MSLALSRSIIVISSCFMLVLTACQVEKNVKNNTYPHSAQRELPSLERQFTCLPPKAAIIAAHRGNSRRLGLAENTMSSLEALYEAGIIMAEVDVAGLRDGTHILFHDGVWDKDTTGRGPVAASTYEQASNYLLRDDEGQLTSSVPARLDEALSFAKGKMYLEIDFKSSAKYRDVLSLIREADMESHVILITYSDGQLRKLASLAPDMMISASVKSLGDIKRYENLGLSRNKLNAWVGGLTDNKPLAQKLSDKGIPILARGYKHMNKDAGPAHVLVSDYAITNKSRGLYPGIIGLSKQNINVYESCLKTMG